MIRNSRPILTFAKYGSNLCKGKLTKYPQLKYLFIGFL